MYFIYFEDLFFIQREKRICLHYFEPSLLVFKDEVDKILFKSFVRKFSRQI